MNRAEMQMKRSMTTSRINETGKSLLANSFNRNPGLNKIVVPIDFSVHSLHALDFAIGLAGRLNAALILVHVLDPLHTPGELDGRRVRSLRAEALRDAKENLAGIGRDRLPRGSRQHVVSGVAHTAIVELARKVDADLVVMGSKGRTGFKSLLVGSVAENVVRQAPCPVLIVRK